MFFYKTQQTLIILLFVCSILIFLDFGVFSVAFLFGSILIGYTFLKTPGLLNPNGLTLYLLSYLFIAFLSVLMSELKIKAGNYIIYIQSIYWFLLAVIIYNAYPAINKLLLSKYIFFSVIILLIIDVGGVGPELSQNAVAFSVIICAPLGYYFLNKYWIKIAFALLLISLMILNGSRTGAVISFFQSGLIFLLSSPKLSKYFKSIVIVLVVLFTIFNFEPLRFGLGNIVSPYNQELGSLLEDPEFVLRNDMAWLERKAQIQKGKQIFADHPILGIGYLNFMDYKIVIDESKIESDRKLKGIDNRSAHNTYINLLAETGILGFLVFIIFFLICLFWFWKKINVMGGSFESYVFVSFFGLLIYFYTISGLLGTSAWIMYGLIAGAANHLKKKSFVKKDIII